MIKQALVLCAVVALNPAWAINKCIGADGKVAFQDAPCAGKGGAIEVKPASGSAPKPTPAVAPAGDSPKQSAAAAVDAPAKKKEGAFGDSWQRRTWLEQTGIPGTRADIDNHQRSCVQKQQSLASQKTRANNNLAGATWEQSISAEMQAAATMCDSKTRDLRTQLESYERELRDLQAKQ